MSQGQLNRIVYFLLPKHVSWQKTTLSCTYYNHNNTHLDVQHSSGESPVLSALSKKLIELLPSMSQRLQALLQLIKFLYSPMCYNTLQSNGK